MRTERKKDHRPEPTNVEFQVLAKRQRSDSKAQEALSVRQQTRLWTSTFLGTFGEFLLVFLHGCLIGTLLAVIFLAMPYFLRFCVSYFS